MSRKGSGTAAARAVASSKRNGARPDAADLHDPRFYINRELGLLAFQRRVLEEAEDERNPLLERVKFLSIVGSNLDEFFMVRVAGLAAQVDAGTVDVGDDGMTPAGQLIAIRREVKKLLADVHKCLQQQLLPALEEAGIRVASWDALSEKQKANLKRYFDETIYPVLTPLAFDPGRPFPHISNLSLNLAVLIRDSSGVERFARVKVPDSLPQLVPVSGFNASRKRRRPSKRTNLVWLEDVIAANLALLFPGMEVVESHPFHVTRDAEVAIKELEAEDLLETIEEGVRQRRFGSVVRLGVTDAMPSHILEILMSNLEVNPNEVYRSKGGPLSLKRLIALHALDRPELKDPPFIPAPPEALKPTSEDDDIFAAIHRNDILLHHPFDSFQPVIDFLRKAARDPHVLAIKIVLYRVGRNAPVVEALLEAMENGKQVAVLLELKARFDEESNIEWARALEQVGVHVVYGLLGLKIHCKVAMVVRREGDAIRRYVHLSTGNYNAVTAHMYTDLGLFTCDEQIADDVTDLFNYLTGYSAKDTYQKVLVAPVNLRQRLQELIEREIHHQKGGRRGHIIFKMNSLVDGPIIRSLYRASQAGVKVQLLVRGICGLRPGISGVSENIEVSSIVGRFLEHSRIYYFRNGGDEQMYVGSADLMERNLNRRVELLFPVENEQIMRRLKNEVLATYLGDTVKKRRMKSDGTYIRVQSSAKRAIDSQSRLIDRARRNMMNVT